jgi:hypothetical protein
MNAYRMPFASRPRGTRLEYFPKYRALIQELAPGIGWRCLKEQGRQWQQVIAENGSALVLFKGDVPVSLHLALIKQPDVELIGRV